MLKLTINSFNFSQLDFSELANNIINNLTIIYPKNI